MNLFKYIKNKIIILFIVTLISTLLFSTTKKAEARDNAFLACFIDDNAHMFKTQVLYTGSELEATYIGLLIANAGYDSLNISSGEDSRLVFTNLNGSYTIVGADVDLSNLKDSSAGLSYEISINDKGKITTKLYNKVNSGKTATYRDLAENFNTKGSVAGAVAGGTQYVGAENLLNKGKYIANSRVTQLHTPLTFPSDVERDATAADINRAYEVQIALTEEFQNALLFANDGKAFESTDALIQTAYILTQSANGTTFTNQYGNQYVITYTAGSGYEGYCTITNYNYYNATRKADSTARKFILRDSSKEKTFLYKVKKGYVNVGDKKEKTESGTKNNLETVEPSKDTEWISWEHLFLEANIFYSLDITYANQADIYSADEFESTLVKMLRNALDSLRGYLSLYTFEDCVFNNGVRGSKGFVQGVYSTSWNDNVVAVYLIMAAITLSLVTLSIIHLIMKRQVATFTPAARTSLMEGIKDILVSVSLVGMSYPLINLLMYINFMYVSIFGAMVGDKTLVDLSTTASNFAGIIIHLAYFVLNIYVNVLYILRGITVPLLIIVSPLCIFAMSFGIGGRNITKAWTKELIGNIFLQSIHATVYGFLVASSFYLRGIESLAIAASIIPLTSLFKEIIGMGGENMIKSAQGLTRSAVTGGAAAAGAAAGTAGGAVSIVGGATGNMGLTVTGKGITASGETIANLGAGIGLEASSVGGGSGNIEKGSKAIPSTMNKLGDQYSHRMIFGGKDGGSSSGGGGDSKSQKTDFYANMTKAFGMPDGSSVNEQGNREYSYANVKPGTTQYDNLQSAVHLTKKYDSAATPQEKNTYASQLNTRYGGAVRNNGNMFTVEQFGSAGKNSANVNTGNVNTVIPQAAARNTGKNPQSGTTPKTNTVKPHIPEDLSKTSN